MTHWMPVGTASAGALVTASTASETKVEKRILE
jgi:hypothetical protein